MATNLVIFIPTIGMLTVWSVIYAVTSWKYWELASSSWAPKVFPYKTLMALGFVLFFLQGVASSEYTMTDIYKGIVPFVILQILGILAIGLYPPLVTYLPELFFGR